MKAAKRKSKGKYSNPSLDVQKIVDCNRSIRIAGKITEETVAELTPEILRLKQESNDPIAVFINSPGGDVTAAQTVLGLLKSPDQFGRTTWINTVVTGEASSAAAILLGSGHYAIGYLHSRILVHGVRINREGVTEEAARWLFQGLASENEALATSLAYCAFDRFFSLYSQLANEFARVRHQFKRVISNYDGLVKPDCPDVPAFALALCEKVSVPIAQVITRALDKLVELNAVVELSRSEELERGIATSEILTGIEDLMASKKRAELRRQMKVLLALLAHRTQRTNDWDLATEDFTELGRDFRYANTASAGMPQQKELLRKVSDYQQILMSPDDLKYFERFTTSDWDTNSRLRTRFDKAVDQACSRAEPLWSFVVTLFRELHAEDNEIPPVDAWWIGLLDEVLGTQRHRRQLSRDTAARLEQIIE